MIDGRDGLAFTRNGNSSITATRGRSRTEDRSSAMASSQPCSGLLTWMPCRTRALPNDRKLTASVSSSAGKYRPPVTEVSVSSRKLFPCRRRPLTTPSIAPRYGLSANESRPSHSRSRSNTCSGFAVTRFSQLGDLRNPQYKDTLLKSIDLYASPAYARQASDPGRRPG